MRVKRSIATAASLAIATVCSLGSADAGSWDWDGGHHGRHWNSGFDDFGWPFFGFAAGLAVGNALAPGAGYGYGRPYYYNRPYYAPTYYPQPYYEPPVVYGGPPVIYDGPAYYAPRTPLYYAPYREDPSYRSNQ